MKTVFYTDPDATDGNITFERVCVQEDIFRSGKMNTALPDISIQYTGNMFDCPPNVAQVDFASKSVKNTLFYCRSRMKLSIRYIGGDVLGNGCAQEEVKFITCPELIAALFFTEPLQDNEALIITGAKPFSTYKGCGRNFEFIGEADLSAPCSDVVIAIDATDFRKHSPGKQYTKEYINREILKAYAGFVKCPTRKIATGNWGGGFLKVPAGGRIFSG
jgi:Poly (ADP-ribose) glycohydrolase (PARG)